MQAGDDASKQNKRFQEYFRRRAMREEGLAGALSPNSATPNTPSEPSALHLLTSHSASTLLMPFLTCHVMWLWQ